MTMNITNGDCLKLMKDLPDKSVDLFICDLPYMETNCAWDQKGVNLDEFWKEFKRLRKSKRTACIHFCSTKFGYTLIKSWEKGFKMDMVLKKRNKTGGLQSRHRPMRNHEMVYFFYEQAPKYNRDKYHKRIQAKNPIVKEEGAIFGKGYEKGKEPPFCKSKFFEPPNPTSVIDNASLIALGDEEDYCYGTKEYHKDSISKRPVGKNVFEPPNPASVVEENAESNKVWGYDKPDTFKIGKNGTSQNFDPPNPASVVEETQREEKDTVYSKKGWEHGKGMGCKEYYKIRKEKGEFEPPNPASVVEELIEPAEDEPVSMFESKKVFIGKRHHQTEKPLDILEFFIKYWSDEGQTILDPTMGSGSTGVACKTLKRNFIGFEMDENIFKVAEGRIKKAEVII